MNAKVNGTYYLTSELHNGRPLFRKRDDPDTWLRFMKIGNWAISSSARKEANEDNCYAYGGGSSDELPPLAGWSVSDEKNVFQADVGITVEHSAALKSMVSHLVFTILHNSAKGVEGVIDLQQEQ